MPKSGRCPVTPQCEPGPNEETNAQGQCVCKSGFERDKNGSCVPRRPECEPGPNEVRNAQGQCVCKSGFERDKNGRCVPPPSPEDARKEGLAVERQDQELHAALRSCGRLQEEGSDLGRPALHASCRPGR